MKAWKRRLIGTLAGTAYAVGLGLILVMMTGGGHGNFTWFVFFLLTSLLGSLYPIVGFIVSDLRSLLSKSSFVAVFIIHIFLVVMFFSEGFLEANTSPRDFAVPEHPIVSAVLISLLSLPQLFCICYFVVQIMRGFDRSHD